MHVVGKEWSSFRYWKFHTVFSSCGRFSILRNPRDLDSFGECFAITFSNLETITRSVGGTKIFSLLFKTEKVDVQ